MQGQIQDIMNFILDDPAVEQQYNEILKKIRLRKNGVVADKMKQLGLVYPVNWGVSIVDLRGIANDYEKNHLLALKLWNKQWRESKIMATLLDEPKRVTEEQMDFWTKSFDNSEIAEQAAANLWVYSGYAFIKALEWCRGKKHIVRFTGIQLMGRLAMVEKAAIDEMFEPFFEVLLPLSKDKRLGNVFFRSFTILGSRSKYLNASCLEFAEGLSKSDSENARQLAVTIVDELKNAGVRGSF